MIAITPIYAAILALVYVYLAIRVIRARRAARVALGTGGDAALERAIRVHGNFAEYVPITLLLLLLLELQGAPRLSVVVIGMVFVAGRGAHAWGMSRDPEDLRFRATGMAITFATIITTSLGLIWLALV
jgi:uncharacterized membrane protein YecN with MAPEG domain